MNTQYRQLLLCLSAFASGKNRAVVTCPEPDWEALFSLASQHKLEAVVYTTLGKDPAFCGGDSSRRAQWRQRAYGLCLAQAKRTAALRSLAAKLEDAGVDYALVKGAICRSLYPEGDARISGDEDLYVPAEHQAACRQVFLEAGLQKGGGDPDGVTHWLDAETGLHIELHARLLEDGEPDAFDYRQPYRVDGLRTLPPAQHLAYLLAHARKHLIAGGVGIRTVCDIAVFSLRFREELDPGALGALLERLGCQALYHHTLAIGRDALGLPCESPLPQMAEDLLEDILDAGIYGQSSLTRRHSGAVTQTSTLRTLFPTREQMARRYPNLTQRPGLLPFYWVKRLASYGLEVKHTRDNSPGKSLRMAKKRLEMLHNYEIISKNP